MNPNALYQIHEIKNTDSHNRSVLNVLLHQQKLELSKGKTTS
jgi:hypothetical protein